MSSRRRRVLNVEKWRPRGQITAAKKNKHSRGIIMPKLPIVYWRDLPAQVIVGKGRRGINSARWPERFEQAIARRDENGADDKRCLSCNGQGRP